MLKKLLNISCHKATYLTSKKEAGETTRMENLKLKIHFGICSGCKRFAAQTHFFCKHAKDGHKHNDLILSEDKKDKIKSLLASLE